MRLLEGVLLETTETRGQACSWTSSAQDGLADEALHFAAMPYYDTIEEDVRRAKEILVRGQAPAPAGVPLRDGAVGGTIYGGDVYAAYKLLESFVAAIEAVGPKVCELALRHDQRHKAHDEAEH